MVKLSTIIKGIILYTLFIIGISILSQYISKKDNQLDLILDSIKEEIKKEYLNKIENFSSVQPNTRHHLDYMSNYVASPISEEQKILEEVNKRLDMSSMTMDNNSYSPLATTSDFSFQNTEYPWKRNTEPVQTYQRQTQIPIDNYSYSPSNNQFLPQKLGFQNGQFMK